MLKIALSKDKMEINMKQFRSRTAKGISNPLTRPRACGSRPNRSLFQLQIENLRLPVRVITLPNIGIIFVTTFKGLYEETGNIVEERSNKTGMRIKRRIPARLCFISCCRKLTKSPGTLRLLLACRVMNSKSGEKTVTEKCLPFVKFLKRDKG